MLLIVLLTIVVFLGMGLFYLDHLIKNAAITDFEHETKYIVVLGAGLRDNQPSLTLWNRLQIAYKYLDNHPNSVAVVSGGLGLGEVYTEAEVMKNYLIELGIDENRIIKEELSTNTFENIMFSIQIIDSLQTDDKSDKTDYNYDNHAEIQELMIITSDFHLYRAKMLANRLGFDAYGVPAATPAIVAKQLQLREYMAVIKSYIFDRL